MLNAGNLLDNRYRLDERVATGGMGDVWRGTDVVLGRTVAVKVLRTAMLEDPEFAARFYGEARMMAAFRHPGVVEVYDYASDGDYEGPEKVAYLVMAFVEGEPLSARVKEGPLGVAETMSIVAQAADALHAAHENGIVHRDVKPGNLIVKPTGAVILVDFGVARSNAMTSVTGLNAIVGTALYMAPEQVAKGNLTPATDIYALGAVAYHCIAGVPPFDGDNALQVALRHLEDDPEPLPDHVPYEVRDLIARAMAKQPADRFQSAAEFAEAAFAVAGPMDWKRLTGTTLAAPISPAARMGSGQFPVTRSGSGQFPVTRMGTGQFPTTPISPAAPRPAPMQRAVPAPVPFSRPGAKPAQPPAQRLLMFAILALFLVAGGIGVAFAVKGDPPAPGSTGKQNQGNQADPILPPPPSAEDSPSVVETSETNTRPTKTKKTPASRSASPSSASPSASSSSPDPTDPTTDPTTEPTTDPTTTAPTTPTTEPVTDPPVNPGG
ncbi:serine/threonine-protein kinase [Actinoplanes flavus]|uniref:non-specific serine/threonine protein kinase n=1 Tax=Actinoplanes flavus TaxID=2820290 RepID=A0ABS3UHW1_9ACTN|nr:serine/threonine-protein kinase [Actinoplanes flavus]MBO3738369.1 protein kinase [Actinoplanes flavus]